MSATNLPETKQICPKRNKFDEYARRNKAINLTTTSAQNVSGTSGDYGNPLGRLITDNLCHDMTDYSRFTLYGIS